MIGTSFCNGQYDGPNHFLTHSQLGQGIALILAHSKTLTITLEMAWDNCLGSLNKCLQMKGGRLLFIGRGLITLARFRN